MSYDGKDGQKACWLARKIFKPGGRLTLLNSCLSNVPLYILSIYPAPKSIIRKLDLYRKRLLWQEGSQSKKNIWLTGILSARLKVKVA